eukprot:9705712-Karenia_brevis.AAC.1
MQGADAARCSNKLALALRERVCSASQTQNHLCAFTFVHPTFYNSRSICRNGSAHCSRLAAAYAAAGPAAAGYTAAGMHVILQTVLQHVLHTFIGRGLRSRRPLQVLVGMAFCFMATQCVLHVSCAAQHGQQMFLHVSFGVYIHHTGAEAATLKLQPFSQPVSLTVLTQ